MNAIEQLAVNALAEVTAQQAEELRQWQTIAARLEVVGLIKSQLMVLPDGDGRPLAIEIKDAPDTRTGESIRLIGVVALGGRPCVETLCCVLFRGAVHEFLECLRLDGKSLANPHKPGAIDAFIARLDASAAMDMPSIEPDTDEITGPAGDEVNRLLGR